MEVHLEEKQTIRSNLEKSIAVCKNLLQSGSNIDIYDSDIVPYTSYKSLLHPVFTETHSSAQQDTEAYTDVHQKNIPEDHSENKYMATAVKCKDNSDTRHGPVSDNVNVIECTDHAMATNSLRKDDDIRTARPLEVEVIDEFYAPEKQFVVYEIAAAADNTAWVCCVNSKFVTRFDSKGTVLEEVEFEQCVNSVSVSPSTDNVWVGSGRSVCEVRDTGIQVRFRVKKPLYCICLLGNGNIAVGMDEQMHDVSVFKAAGERVLYTEVKDIPLKLTECHVTKDIAVLLINSIEISSSSIVVMDKLLSKQRVIVLRESSFDDIMVSSVSYDRNGNIIVGAVPQEEYLNNNLTLLYRKGRGFRTIANDKSMEGCQHPVNSISKTGVLWRVFHDDLRLPQKIQLLKY